MARAIRESVEAFITAGVLSWDRVGSLESLKPSTDFNSVALDEAVSYEQVYLKGLSLRYFNFLLVDQSFVQLSVGERSARFAYYPNPFTDPDGLLELVDDPVDAELIDPADLKATAGRAPLRYDFAPPQYVKFSHPYAHLHLGHGELGRLATRRIYSALSFSLLVLRLYYPTEWSSFKLPDPPKNGFDNSLDRRLAESVAADRTISEEFFSPVEARLPYLG